MAGESIIPKLPLSKAHAILHSMRKWVIISILVIVALVLLFIWREDFSIVKFEQDSKGGQNVVTTATSTDTRVPYDPTAATSTSTEGWKTYTDAEFDFSFKYPPTHAIFESGMIKPLPDYDPTKGKDESGQTVFGFKVSDKSKNDFINEFQTNPAFESISVKSIHINNMPGVLITHRDPFTGEFKNTVLLSLPSGRLLVLSYFQRVGSYSQNQNQEQNSIFDTILQSIKSTS
jgi:hypothetical protein